MKQLITSIIVFTFLSLPTWAQSGTDLFFEDLEAPSFVVIDEGDFAYVEIVEPLLPIENRSLVQCSPHSLACENALQSLPFFSIRAYDL